MLNAHVFTCQSTPKLTFIYTMQQNRSPNVSMSMLNKLFLTITFNVQPLVI